MIRHLGTAAIALAVMLTAPAAQAAPRQVGVRYSDLNLANPADVRTLEHRIADAAAQVCPFDFSPGTGITGYIKARDDRARCITATIAQTRSHAAWIVTDATRLAASGN